MGDHLIVDGYNVIFAWPETSDEMKKNGLESARNRLINTLINHAAITGIQTTIVFDAAKTKDSQHEIENTFGLKAIYTMEGETADNVIEKLTKELSRLETVYVATSDWLEQRMILGHGAFRLTPKELLSWVERAKKDAEGHYTGGTPVDGYLERSLTENVRSIFEKWRRKRS
ncbi:MAG TPA: NYN domain-containing protein [Desulfotomaculum sp.]|nr:MAG: hypothetical protein XD84_1625 [Desulfotomaculum sp. 46_80]KUK85264.1 MAG: hypothetical protein XE00_0207 [Desulfofundulus kuznetsovii]HAG11447.1 NYN domain-containing protein [Desulfotomaculum sp.]HBY03233.1 NYN domain-containing protein [Desulfotomaculum sp.]